MYMVWGIESSLNRQKKKKHLVERQHLPSEKDKAPLIASIIHGYPSSSSPGSPNSPSKTPRYAQDI